MAWKWGGVARKSGKWPTLVWLITAGLVALYLGMVEPRNRYTGIAEQKATGLAAVEQNSTAMLRPSSSLFNFSRASAVPNSIALASLAEGAPDSLAASNTPPTSIPGESPDRKLTRTVSLDLIVQHPGEAAAKVQTLAERLGGYLETSLVNGDPDSASASLTIRVPAARFEEARSEIRKLALRVENEKVEAQDVTKQYVDQDAQLRNLRAEEEQYLGILKHASTVSDTLEVSQKLNEVRGQIEQQQAEFDALSRQIETVAITVSLQAEADAQVLGLHWRPLYRLKMAAREGLDGFGSYLATMTSLLFYLPAILLWLATILLGTAFTWRILRRCVRVLFGFPRSGMPENRPN
jgi:hypothetical protein